MGVLKDIHGITMLGRAPEGTCEMCGVQHDPTLPHNRDSLMYQYKFYDQHGRFPSWADAMEHCDEEMKRLWTESLEQRGIDVKKYPKTEMINMQVMKGKQL